VEVLEEAVGPEWASQAVSAWTAGWDSHPAHRMAARTVAAITLQPDQTVAQTPVSIEHELPAKI
jgi:hypothetical protein